MGPDERKDSGVIVLTLYAVNQEQPSRYNKSLIHFCFSSVHNNNFIHTSLLMAIERFYHSMELYSMFLLSC